MSDTNSIYCPSCQQRTSLAPRQHWHSNSDGYNYSICECNGEKCNQHFLVKRDGTGSIVDMYPKAIPKPVNTSIPSPIREDFEEAYKCLSVGAWRATVTMARRAMQNICIEKGAPTTVKITTKSGKERTVDNKLVNQIDWLFSQHIITNDLKDWAHEIRSVGNDGAHPGDASDPNPVTEEDAKDILELVEAFCGPLYVAAAVYNKRKVPTADQ